MPEPGHTLRALFARRWCVPILAHLHAAEGAKFVSLCHAIGAAGTAVRDALDHLIELGLVRPNPGYGHPLRPEYILTRRGDRLSAPAARLDDALAEPALRDLALRRWTIPVLHSVGALAPARFATLVENLDGVSPRALSIALKDLSAADLVRRRVIDDFPPRPEYLAAARARPILEAAEGLLSAG